MRNDTTLAEMELSLSKLRLDIDNASQKLLNYCKSEKIVKSDISSIKDVIIAELDMPGLNSSELAKIKRISSALKDLSELIVVDFDMPKIDKRNITLADKLRSLPKLSEESRDSFEKGIEISRSMKLPDSAWEG